jgi:hypothetical protein
MTGDRIRYRSGYRFQLVNDYRCRVDILPESDIVTELIELSRDGVLLLRHTYAWDGPSDPIVWIMPKVIRKYLLRKFMRGSLVHDALAQLMRDTYLDRSVWFTATNKELRKICVEDGMWKLRAWLIFIGVEHLGGRSWVEWGDGGKELCDAP